jgi:HEAT repeat protein
VASGRGVDSRRGGGAKRRALEETLAALRRVRERPDAEESRAELRQALAGEGSHAAARAAALAGELGIGELVPDLVAAFPRFFEGLPKADPGCSAKTAIVEALRRLEHDDPELYRRGAAHVQVEPVFGGRVDTAVDLRGASALALAETAVADVLADLAGLLADPEPPVRISAARAVAAHGRAAGIPLLRLKSLSGDPEPRVVSECLLGLLRLDARREMPFVASFLQRSGETAEAAAVALGESRLPEALPVLREWVEPARRRGLGRAAFLAVAALRRDEAVDLLLAAARDEEPAVAKDALAALASVGTDAALLERARSATAGRPELHEALARAFGKAAPP